MSSDLLLGTFGDISKVQQQIEATVNNNCMTKHFSSTSEVKAKVATIEEHVTSQYTDKNEQDSNLEKKELHECGKLERAKMLAEGYTTGMLVYIGDGR